MKHKEYIVWDCNAGYSEDFIEDIREENPDLNEDEVLDMALETNADYLEDERMNLNIPTEGEIVAIAVLGLWNGKKSAYKVFKEQNVSTCLSSSYNPVWYVDENGDFRCHEVHHDGINEILYREFKEGISETQKDNFLAKIYDGTVTRRDITKYTKRLGDRIAAVYGWNVKK